MSTIEVTEVVQALKDAVEQEGADTRRGCHYVAGGTPWCIAGVVLHKLGVSMKTLSAMEEVGEILSSTNNDRILFNAEFTLSSQAVVVLGEAQATQDKGHAWGYALASALNTFERVSQ